MGTCIEIVDWDKHFENNRTRELKHMAWVPVSNKMDGTGYTSLLDHPNGAAHLGAWLALLEVASRCDVRGTLSRDGAEAMDEVVLERITRVPVGIWLEVLPRLLNIKWIKGYESHGTIPQEGAAKCPLNGTELNGTELNGTELNGRERKRTSKIAADAAIEKKDPRYLELYGKLKSAFESKNAEMDYKREGPAMKWITEHALTRDDPNAFLKSMLNLFWALTHDAREKIWYQQPFIPSVMRSGGLWPRLLTKLQDHVEDSNAAAQVAELTRGWWT